MVLPRQTDAYLHLERADQRLVGTDDGRSFFVSAATHAGFGVTLE